MSNVNGFSARSVPFYGLPNSKIISDAPTLHDALDLAGLNWDVEIQRIYQNPSDAGTFVEIPNKYLTVRTDTQNPLGVVGNNYTIFQNEEAFSFADELLGFGVQFDAAGSYDNDRKIFLTAKLPDGITVPDTDDSLDLFLLFRSSHDGSGAIQALITPIRLACTNMMNLATRSMVSKWSTRHTRSASDKVQEAARTLNLVDKYRTEFLSISAALRDTDVNLEGFTALIKEVTESERHHTGMLQTWRNSPSVDRSTGWGAVNAIGEYFEWERGGKGTVESRFDSNLDGQTAAVRNRAVQLLTRR